jgi:hypothetical protein
MGDCQFDIHIQDVDSIALEVRSLGCDFFPSQGHFACQMLIFAATHYTRTSYEFCQCSRRPNEILIVRTLIPNFVRT